MKIGKYVGLLTIMLVSILALSGLSYAISDNVIVEVEVDGTEMIESGDNAIILDLERDELIGADLTELCRNIVDEKGDRIEPKNHPLTRTLNTSFPVRNQVVGTNDDPMSRTWLMVNTEPVFDLETKKVDEVICTFIDITEQKNIGDALEESEERYRHIFENSPIGIGISAMDGKVITANKAMLDIMGYTLDEVRTINIADTYANAEDRVVLLRALSQNGRVTDYRVRLLRKDGTSYDAVLNISSINIGGKDYYHTMCQVATSNTDK